MRPTRWTAVVTLMLLGGSFLHAENLNPRVRSSHPYLRAMITEAELRSSTFREIVARIEATDGIVYVEHGSCPRHVRACLSHEVTGGPGHRILRANVDARQRDWDVMALIGHELRHAVEVLENPQLTDANGVYFFYAKDKELNDRAFETREAADAEDAVRKEVASFAKGRPD